MVASTDTSFPTSDYLLPSMKTNLPPNLLRPIDSWAKEDVQQWIEYCIEEYALGEINSNNFGMNGKALSLLGEEGFKQRAPRSGDILYKALHQHNTLIKSLTCQTISHQLWNTFGLLPSSWMRHLNIPFPPLPPPNMPYLHSALNYMYNRSESKYPTTFVDSPQTIRSRQTSNSSSSSVPKPLEKSDIHYLSSSSSVKHEYINDEDIDIEQPETLFKPSMSSYSHKSTSSKASPPGFPRVKPQANDAKQSEGMENTRQIRYYQDRIDFHGDILMKPKAAKNCRILWEFLYILLEDPLYESIIHWENREKMIFRINQADKLAALWGLQKNRLSMTYEKLSRGMRYYYSNNIISKEQSKRLLYRFMRSPDEIRKNMKRQATSTTASSPVVTKNSLLPETRLHHQDLPTPLMPPQFLHLLSTYPSMLPNFNPTTDLLLPVRDTSISKSDRASSSSPDSLDSSHDSDKQYSSSSYSSTTKRKQTIPMSLTARLLHSYPFDKPLDLAAGKLDGDAMGYKHQ